MEILCGCVLAEEWKLGWVDATCGEELWFLFGNHDLIAAEKS
jgi:hypothetical protein